MTTPTKTAAKKAAPRVATKATPPKPAPEEITYHFVKEVRKGAAARYDSDSEDWSGSLYVPKTKFGGEFPESFTTTVNL